MKLWLRKINLIMGDREFTNDKFEIDFRVPFSKEPEPDISEIKIYNLSENTIANIKSKAYVILNAGYKGDVGNILSGKIEKITSEWEKVDKVTKITLSDGGFEWRNAKINKTYQKGITAKYIMQDLANILGLEIAEINPTKNISYNLGRTINGSVGSALKQLVKDTGSKMYINKGKLYIREDNKGNETGFLLDSEHGLIDSPERIEEEKNGEKIIKYKIKSLLNYKLTTDSIIEVKSRTLNGFYRVIEGVHTGDFITECIVVPT